MKVYLSEIIHDEAIKKISEEAEIVSDFNSIEEIDAIILRTLKVTREMMEKAKNLKVIGKHGIGYDSIDIDAAKELGIKVVYTPTANIQSVAELIVSLMSNASRNICDAYSQIRNSALATIAPRDLIGVELSGKTLGLIGAGNIARTAAGILQKGFDMKVLCYDVYLDKEQCATRNMEKCDELDDLLSRSDFVSISLPLTDETRGMIGEKELDACKGNCILVNTARGGIVDEKALYQALKNGKIRAAACDVFLSEPPNAENPLTQLKNFIATPHIGASTEEAMYRMGMTVVEDVLAVLHGKDPLYRVV